LISLLAKKNSALSGADGAGQSSATKVLEIAMAAVKAEQEAFAEAAKKIDPNKPAIDVFKQIQSEHPASDKLIPDISKDLDKLRKYVVSRRLCRNSVGDSRESKRDPAISARHLLRLDGYSRSVREARHRAYYYVTPTEEEWPEQEKQEWLTAFNYYTSEIVSIHEVYPGHYVPKPSSECVACQQSRKIFGSYGLHRRLGALLRKND